MPCKSARKQTYSTTVEQMVILEARRADGSPYPSSSIYQILCGLLRHARSHWKDCPNFLDKQNTAFTELRGTCDRLARELRQEGVGAKVNSIITPGRAFVGVWSHRYLFA